MTNALIKSFILLFKSFNHENHDSEDEKPGILSLEADHLSSGLEDETDDSLDETGQNFR